MIDSILFVAHYALLLLFGIVLSAAFAGVRHSKKNISILLGLYVLCGALQLIFYLLFSERLVWMLYPLITHLPIVLLLCIYYRKRLSTVLAAVTTAYLCCQPAKWFGLLFSWLTNSYIAEQSARIAALLLVAAITLRWFASYLAMLYQKDDRSVFIFGIVPMVYYLFDYTAGIYTDLWLNSNRVAIEFLPLLLCSIYMLFCVVYFKEYERKNEAERKEHIICLTLEQQAKELEAIKRSEQEIRLLRHDMRLFLNNLSYCIAEDPDAAQQMISSFSSNVDATSILRYCENSTINYVLSDCAAKCREAHIAFAATVEIGRLSVDEILFCTILSNALDNALNAQDGLAKDKRSIKVLLKTSDERLLLSVKNSFASAPVFIDDMPVTKKAGHGYGTRSIRYMTERLGGNCQFTVEDQRFVLRVVI